MNQELQEMQDMEEVEIDLLDLVYYLWKKAVWILLGGILAAVAASSATKWLVPPTYVSSTKMYVLSRQNEAALTSSDMQLSNLLIKDYVELVKSRTVTEAVIEELGLPMTHEQLLGKISVSTPSDSRIVTISVTDEDPIEASQIANAVRDIAAVHIQQVMEIEAVNVVEEANIPTVKAGPNIKKNGMIGGCAGCMVVAGVFLLLYLLDDTIKKPEDVERYLHLSSLGMIPLDADEKKSRKKRIKRQFRMNMEGGR